MKEEEAEMAEKKEEKEEETKDEDPPPPAEEWSKYKFLLFLKSIKWSFFLIIREIISKLKKKRFIIVWQNILFSYCKTFF